jgi:membrane protease YdiL (CAAX protease family)
MRPHAPPTPGWYDDPWRVAPYRWWDGLQWTGHTQGAPAPVTYQQLDPLPRARDDITGGGIAILGFFGAFALALVCSYVAVALGFAEDSVAVEVVGHAGLWGGLFMAALMVTHRRPGGSLKDLGFYWPTWTEGALGFGMAFGAIFVEGFVINALKHLLPPENRGISSSVFVSHTPSATAIFITALLVCIGAPIFEELFFRGVVQGILTHRVGAGPAIAIQALLFGCAHFQYGMTANQAIVRIAGITVVGLFLGWLRQSTGRLGAGIFAHATNNTFVVIVTIALLARG